MIKCHYNTKRILKKIFLTIIFHLIFIDVSILLFIMKFNLAGVVLSTITYLGMIIASNIGDGFGDGPFKVGTITYGLLLSVVTSFVLTLIPWWGQILPWITFLIVNTIILFFTYKGHVNVVI